MVSPHHIACYRTMPSTRRTRDDLVVKLINAEVERLNGRLEDEVGQRKAEFGRLNGEYGRLNGRLNDERRATES